MSAKPNGGRLIGTPPSAYVIKVPEEKLYNRKSCREGIPCRGMGRWRETDRLIHVGDAYLKVTIRDRRVEGFWGYREPEENEDDRHL